MINFGELYSHYQEEEISIIALATEQFVPSSLGTISDDESVSIFKTILLRHKLDYSISATGNEINFTDALSRQIQLLLESILLLKKLIYHQVQLS